MQMVRIRRDIKPQRFNSDHIRSELDYILSALENIRSELDHIR